MVEMNDVWIVMKRDSITKAWRVMAAFANKKAAQDLVDSDPASGEWIIRNYIMHDTLSGFTSENRY